jgi:ADP-heptose:LPS heptosyltransferase
MIQCSPAIRRLSEHLGQSVDVLLNRDFPGCGALFAGAPWVGSVFPLDQTSWSRRFDLVFVFDFVGPAPPAPNADRLVESRRGFLAITRRMHEAEYNLRDLGEQLGLPYAPQDVGRYFIGGYDRGVPEPGRIGLHAGCKPGVWEAKRWPGFEALAGRLAARGFELVSFGGSGEHVPGTIDATGTPLRATIEAMRRCAYFISNDSGLMHVADALGIPLTAIFGPTSVVKNGPLAPTSRVVALNKPCAPCQFDMKALAACRCIVEIDLETVLEAVVRHMEAPRAGEAQASG